MVLSYLALGFFFLAGGCSNDDSSEGEGGGGSSAGQGGGNGGVNCSLANAEELPETIEEDLEVGPGRVTVATTRMEGGATLTIAPGTTVLMQPAPRCQGLCRLS